MQDLARTPQQLGAIIRRARKRRNWTQTDLANGAGLRQQAVSLIESGRQSGKIDTILAILAALELELHVAPRTRTDPSDIEGLF